jgi:hypothetical protein
MSDGSFDLILQELLHQREIMDSLEAENRELRQQLADLREGRGIFVEIEGHRFALISEAGNIPAPADSLSIAPLSPVIAEQEKPPVFVAQEPVSTAGLPDIVEESEPVVSEVPPNMNFLLEDDGPISSSPFLQDIFDEETAAIPTSKMATWGESPSTPLPTSASTSEPVPGSSTEPIQKPVQSVKLEQQSTPIDEDEKAALRRQLIGSFLLE